ncbi:MAG: pentapeptide repeat-containing protein [Ruthenibacterium lactatiformans]
MEDTPWGRMKVVRQQDFDKAFAQGATDFSNCYFDGVTFNGEAAEISFQNSILTNDCLFDHAHFKDAAFDGASVYCYDTGLRPLPILFLHATISGHVERTDLSGCFFKDSHINRTSFADCVLNRCIMYETALNSTYFVRCEAFGLQHMDTMRLTMGGATDREVENYIRQVTEALTPQSL